MKKNQQYGRLADQVYRKILARLNDQLALSSQKLSVSQIANDLNVSRTPVTMALVRLECEGLVSQSPDGGWYTNSLTLEDIDEIFELKEAVDPTLMSKAAERITPDAAHELLAAVEEMERAAGANDLERWLEADERYHEILFTVVRNERLKRVQEQLNSQIFKLRLGQMVIGERMLVSSRQHREMAETVVAGDAKLAADVTLKHIHSLKASLVHLVKNILLPVMGAAGSARGSG